MRFLRTNTACRVTVGPFFDKTDGVTPETALTVTAIKLTLMVDDANVPTLILDTNPTASGGNNDMVHVTGDDAGFYDLELTAANLNYLGRAMLALTDAANHCPVFHEFMILPAMIYDSLILGTDRLDTNVTHVTDQSQTAGDIPALINTVDDFLDTEIAAIKAKTDNLPSDPADASDIASSFSTVNTKLDTIDDFLDTEVAAIKAKTDNLPTDPADASDIAALVTAVDDFVDTEIAAIKAKTDQLTFGTPNRVDAQVYGMENNVVTAAAVAADAIGASELAADAVTEIQSGLATAANLATVAGYLDTEIAAILADTNELQTDLVDGGRLDLLIDAIKAKTDNLPSDPADASVVAGLIAAAEAKIDTVDTVVDAIKAKTDNLPSDPADASVIAGLIDALPTAAENAEELLKHDMNGITGEADRSPLNALRFLRNKWSISGSTLTVTKEDDLTSAWTATISTNAGADPITGSDPA